MTAPNNYQENKLKENKNKKKQNQGKKDLTNKKFRASQMKVIQTLSVVCGFFFICYLPTMILLFLVSVLTSEQMKFWFSMSSIFAFMNCAANPVIYVGMHATMRKKFLEIIKFWK